MNEVTSADGTPIAFERFGDGQPVILVAGALCDRSAFRPLAEQLSRQQFTVINYDRRGRGDSGDTQPYAVEREIEDLGALITEIGGTASVYGHSSGAALALHATVSGLPISKLVLHDLPVFPKEDVETRRKEQEADENIKALLAQDRRADAIELFLRGTGMPPEMIEQMSSDERTVAIAPTLRYDLFEVISDRSRDGRTPAEQASGVTVPALALCGGAGFGWVIDTARQIADAIPNGRYAVLEGQNHFVPPEVLAPVLAEFFAN